jgi:2',3'-cyclic-nucleotide 2'-phosphodiesterase (5'-nucleotidase family)
MARLPAWLQAALLGATVLLIGAFALLALNGQLSLVGLQSTWELTVLHTNDVSGYTDACG